MYHGYYGLSRPPFAVTPDPTLLYMSKMHREALATILYGVATRKGFIVCTGEVGTGKTTVIRAFCDQASTNEYKIVYVFMPQIGPEQLTYYICQELGVEPSSSVNTIVQRLQLKLLELYNAGQTAVLLIDEAQHLSADTLEFLRLLSNLETDSEKLLQIVLVGQPEFDEMLARHDMRQVHQRVALRARLDPLEAADSLKYIDHRLTATGARDTDGILTKGAARTIAGAARGIPRTINILADNVLIAGFGLDEKPVNARTARRVVKAFTRADDDRKKGWLGLFLQRAIDLVAHPSRAGPRRLGWRAWIGVTAVAAVLVLLALAVSLTDSLAAAQLLANDLYAHARVVLHIGDQSSLLQSPRESAVIPPEAQDVASLPSPAGRSDLAALESTTYARSGPLVAVVAQPPEPAAEVTSNLVAPAPSVTPAVSSLSAAEVGALLARGNFLLGRGDIISARLFFKRAADAGDGQAALLMNATFDPEFFNSLGVRGGPGEARAGSSAIHPFSKKRLDHEQRLRSSAAGAFTKHAYRTDPPPQHAP